MKSFDAATRQVAGLMAAIGGNVDAYEDDKSSGTPACHTTFDAALASVEASIQYNEPKVGSYQHIKKVTEAATGKKQSDLVREMAELCAQMGGLTEDPFIEEIVKETTPTAEEEAIIAKMKELIPEVDCEDRQDDGKFWGDLYVDTFLPQVPKPVEPCYKFLSSLYADGCEELLEIYQAFSFAVRTGEPQTVTLDSGTYEMTQGFGGTHWQLYDTGKGRKYCQESVWKQDHVGVNNHYDLVEESDLFLWVIAEDQADGDDLGYIHNQWVFLREQE